MLNRVGEIGGDKVAWGATTIQNGLSAFEELLKLSGPQGKYCLGDELTLADAFLIPQLYNCGRFKVDIS